MLTFLKTDYFVTAVKKIFLVVSGFSVAVVLARYLGQELRADYAVVVNSAAVIAVLLNFGVSNRYQSERRVKGIEISRVFCLYSLILFSSLVVLGFLLLGFLDVFHASIFIVAVFSLLRMQLQAYTLVESIQGSAFSSILGSMFELSVLLLLWLFFPASLVWALAAILVKEVIISLLSLKVIVGVYAKNREDFSDGKGPLLRSIFSLSLLDGFSLLKASPVFLLTLLIVINYKIDVILLNFMGVDKAVIGVFAVGVLVAEYLWIFSDIFKDVQVSRTSRGSPANEVAVANRAAIFVTLVVYVCFILFGQFSVLLLFGSEYYDSYKVALMMLVANIFMIPCKILGSYLISVNSIRVYLYVMVVSVAINIILSFALIPYFGYLGAIFSSILSYAVAGLSVTLVFVAKSGLRLRQALVFSGDDAVSVIRYIKR